jgi:hypothetical protein
VIAVHLRNSRYLTVNPSAALLWPLLYRGTTVAELAGALIDRWGLEEHRAWADADGLVTCLRRAGLLIIEGAEQ